MGNQQKAVDFFEKKGREFQAEFSALFSDFGINKVVNGYTISELLQSGTDELKQGIADVLNGDYFAIKAQENNEKNIESFIPLKVLSTVKKVVADKPQQTQEIKKSEQKNETTTAPIYIGLAVIVVLIIVVVIISKSNK